MSNSDLRLSRSVATILFFAAIVGGIGLSIGLSHWGGRIVSGAPALPVAVAHNTNPVLLGSLSNGFASILKPALPAIVNIRTSKIVKNRGENSPMFTDPFFRQFFGNQFGQQQPQMPQSQREQSLGSGVMQ